MESSESGFESNVEHGKQPVACHAADPSCALDLVIEVLEDMQKVVSKGRMKSVRIRLGDRVIAEVPVTLTAVAAVAAGLAAVMLTKLAIEVEHED